MKRITSIISWTLILTLAAGPIFPLATAKASDRAVTKTRVSRASRKSTKKIYQTPAQLAGQSSTALPGGGLLVAGGEGPDGPEKTSWVRDGVTGEVVLTAGLSHARAHHSATMLPNGNVLIVGGVDASGQIETRAELFDLESRTFRTLKSGPTARAFHTATLLIDGRVVIAGGVASKRNLQSKVDIWDPRTESRISPPSGLSVARQKHKATLLSDGSISLQGGQDSNGNEIQNIEIFDPLTNNSSIVGVETTSGIQDAPFVAASLPANGAGDVPVDTTIAFRFSQSLRAESISADTLSLLGPEGSLRARVVPAEHGRLAFITPEQPLLAGTTYVVSLSNSAAENGQKIQSTTLSFTTKAEPNSSIDEEDWIPDERNYHGEWKIKHEDSPWRSLPPLQAETGVTALAGQTLTLDGKPLKNVTLSNGTASALTDQTGRFLLSSVSSGRQVLTIDGRTAGRPRKEYGVFRVAIDIKPDKTNALDYTIWMTKLDTSNATVVSSPTKTSMSITNPRIPGLELKLPAGTVIRDLNGQTVSRISITPIPTNRPPFPLPLGVDVPVYFTIQPGGAQIIPPRAQLIYPNFIGRKPGERIDFWNYDPTEKGWYVYGRGTVTPDGKQIVPDAGVVLYEFSGAMVALPSGAPSLFPEDGAEDGDPVDLGTGLLIVEKMDLSVSDTIPIALNRTYRPQDTLSRAFGIGATHPYDIFLVGSTFPYTYVDLIMPDGARVHYDRISPGTLWLDAVYEATASPGPFYKSRIVFGSNCWELRLRDGTMLVFKEAFAGANPRQGGLLRIQDRNGNVLNITRDSNSNVSSITTPNNRWIKFTYDSSLRVTQATDNIGRTVGYTYDTSGRLWKVTDVKNGVTEYTYDSSHRMLTIKDPRGITYLTNEYDSNGRVIKQTLADDTPGNSTDNPTYQFGYTTDSAGRIIQTDVTDPRGHVRRVTFNSVGYRLTDTSAFGLPEQQGISFQRQTGSNLLTAFIDAMGRRTEYTYDSMGNALSVVQFAGTTSAATTTLTYESTFNQVSTITDALNNTTSYTYDSKGNVLAITDPLNHQITYTYNSAGQVISVTDALLNTTYFNYEGGDLISFTDPLNRTSSLFIDGAGRIINTTDASGNTRSYEYDVFNAVTKTTQALGGVTEFTYDPNGNLLTLKDARNQTTTFTYDNMDRTLTRTDSLQGSSSTETYEYDLEGNVTKQTDRRGKVTTLSYDALGRTIFAGFDTQAGPTYESTIGYSYDLYNRITQVDDSASGTINYSFNDLSRTASETTPLGTVGYTYDQIGRLTGKSVSGQPAITYGYDNANRLLSITQGVIGVSFTYDNANRQTSTTLPNGVVEEYGYDNGSQLTAITVKNGATVLGDLSYEYDKSGRRSKMGGSLARLKLPQPLSSATYNAANRVTQSGSATLTYDANGNLTNDGTNAYTWNARNQLTSISGTVSASFEYDAFGRRVSKTVNGTTTHYLYDGMNAVQEQSGGTATANMLTGGIDQLYSRTETAGTQSVVRDSLGSTVALLDSLGNTQTEYTYEPFGNTNSGGAASTNPSQYTGRENDGTGLYYYRARYYSPTLQRFISEDPIGFAGGDTNLYAYVGNSPCNATDATGNWANILIGCASGMAFTIVFNWFFGRKTTWWEIGLACAIGAVVGSAPRIARGAKGFGKWSPNPKPPANYPKPPNWKPDWTWRYPEGLRPKSPRWFDPKGGEWRWHPADKWHPKGHWDHNPWTDWNSPWQNIFH